MGSGRTGHRMLLYSAMKMGLIGLPAIAGAPLAAGALVAADYSRKFPAELDIYRG